MTVVGGGHFLIASILPWSVAISWAETMYPRYVICLQNSSHLEDMSFIPACSSFLNIASSFLRWLARSFKKMTISSKEMIHWLRLRSPRQVSMDHWKVAGSLANPQGIPLHSQNPNSPMETWSEVCTPHPSWPASTQTSGQVKGTIGTPAGYWGFPWCGIASKHPSQSNSSASWGQYRKLGSHPSFRPGLLH